MKHLRQKVAKSLAHDHPEALELNPGSQVTKLGSFCSHVAFQSSTHGLAMQNLFFRTWENFHVGSASFLSSSFSYINIPSTFSFLPLAKIQC